MAAGRSGRGIAALVERQMRNWELARRQQVTPVSESPPAVQIKFYLAISRECGCGAEDIAQKVAERSGFERFDKEIFDYMVAQDDVRRRLFETLDDRTIGWIEDVCSSLAFGLAVGETEYFNRLTHALLAICHNTHGIIIGRAANFVLPPEAGLAVRLVATEEYRVEKYAERTDLALKESREEMERIDRGRSQFIEDRFGKYAYDPRRYDLVLNVERFTPDAVADIMISAIKAKAGDKLRLPIPCESD